MSRIRRGLGVELPLRKMFEKPTVAGMSQVIVGTKKADGVGSIQRVSREKPLPLSYAQQRLWFIEQLEPGNSAYNVNMVMRVEGRLEVRSLERAVEEIVRRHEVLRTRFEWGEGEAVQVIEEEARIR